MSVLFQRFCMIRCGATKFNSFYKSCWRPISNCNNVFQNAQAVTASAPQHDKLEGPSSDGDSDKSYPKHIEDLVDSISRLTLLEVADLNELLKKRLGIEGAAMMPMMAGPMPVGASGGAFEDEEEAAKPVKSSFNVKLLKFDATKKVQLIKEIKALLPEMNLVQSKKFVESAPEIVKKDVSKEEAEELKKSLEAAGGTVEIE